MYYLFVVALLSKYVSFNLENSYFFEVLQSFKLIEVYYFVVADVKQL